MANTNLTALGITREAVRILHNSVPFIGSINKQYDNMFDPSGQTPGDTITIRMPNQFEVRTGAIMSVKDLKTPSLTLQIATQKGVDLNFGAKELALELDDFSGRILKPAIARLASELDFLALEAGYRGVYNLVGTAGTTPATAKVVLDAAAKMDDSAAPMDEFRHLAINPAANASIVDALKGLFHRGDNLSKQYVMGQMGEALGFNWARTQNINRHTVGKIAGTVLTKGASSEDDTTVDLDGFTGASDGTVKVGDVFTIGSVNSVNPETKKDTGNLQQFVVTADKSSVGSNEILAVAISPTISSTGAYQTVTALPANNAAVTFVGTSETAYPMNMAYHRDFMTMATKDLPMPTNAFAARVMQDGVSLRLWKGDDITNDKFPARIDVLFGFKVIRPELGCRIIG